MTSGSVGLALICAVAVLLLMMIISSLIIIIISALRHRRRQGNRVTLTSPATGNTLML